MPGEYLNVLLIEDNPGDVRLFQEALREAFADSFHLSHCSSFAQALEELAKLSHDVMVVDLGLPDAWGLDVVQRARIAAPGVPVVVLTSRIDEGLGVRALQEGAQDYLIKGELDPHLLSRALRYAIERHRAKLALQSESLMDELTKLYNRRGFMTLAGSHVQLADRMRTPFALAFVDLDDMKQINDTLGHLEGDRALNEAANLLRGCVRQSDIVARFGGDEFVLLFTTAGADSEARFRKRLVAQLDAVNAQVHRQYRLSLSVGFVTVGFDRWPTLEEVLAEADASMYKEKQQKKGIV